MTEQRDPPAAGALQFETVELASAASSIVCARCSASIPDQYWQLGTHCLCGDCKAKLQAEFAAHAQRSLQPSILSRALLFGSAAALAGAALYWAVARFMGLEIGIVALAIGYAVGWTMLKATGNVGARRYQVVGALLTYLSVGIAYTALALPQFDEPNPFTLAMLVVSLPVLGTLANGASGLIGAIIIGFGVYQAWRMLAPAQPHFVGPLRVGAVARAPS